MKLPRHAEYWLGGYASGRLRRSIVRPDIRRVWLAIADHFEPLWNQADHSTALARVTRWREALPKIAATSARDSAGEFLKYTFFFAQEEYAPEFVEPLAEMVRMGIADVEIHIHHDREGRQDFTDRMTRFRDTLSREHGLLHSDMGLTKFGFIHGNWALDNSLPGGKWCGLNDEISILRDLGCYADFTMPSGASHSQARLVNTLYWCTDDVNRPKSYDTGTPVSMSGGRAGDLLMIPGPLGIRWKGRLTPRMETGEIAGNDLPSRYRAKRWIDIAPQLGSDVFVKLYTHGTQERNSVALLNGALAALARFMADECESRGAELKFVTTWEMYERIMQLAGANLERGVLYANR